MFTAAILLFIKHLFIKRVYILEIIILQIGDLFFWFVFVLNVKSRPDIAVSVEQL